MSSTTLNYHEFATAKKSAMTVDYCIHALAWELSCMLTQPSVTQAAAYIRAPFAFGGQSSRTYVSEWLETTILSAIARMFKITIHFCSQRSRTYVQNDHKHPFSMQLYVRAIGL